MLSVVALLQETDDDGTMTNYQEVIAKLAT